MKDTIKKETLERLLRDLSVSVDELRNRCRKVDLVDARCLVAAALKREDGVRQQDIADLMGVSQAAVSKMLDRHRNQLDVYRAYRERWEALSNQG